MIYFAVEAEGIQQELKIGVLDTFGLDLGDPLDKRGHANG